MNQGYIFREAQENEAAEVLQIICERIAWMDEVGIQSWNTTDYLERYPLAYYIKRAQDHELFVLVDADTRKIASAAVLLREDSRWNDHAPAIYIHNLVAAADAKGAGTILLERIEAYAQDKGVPRLRLDSIEGNAIISSYYEKRGFVPAGKCAVGVYHGILREKRLHGSCDMEPNKIRRLSIRKAVEADVPFLTKVYNQAIADGRCTCDTESVSEAERYAWMLEHSGTSRYPIFICEDGGASVGYAYFSPYRPGRKAVAHVAEISCYLDFPMKGKQLGSYLLGEMLKTAPEFGISVLIAILLDCNQASIALLKKFGFHEWGRMPQIARLPSGSVDHLIYGLRLQ